MRYIDLFAGIGGFHYGIQRANQPKDVKLQSEYQDKRGNNSNKLQRTTLTCVYSNEYDKYANSVYRKHFGECDQRDITTVPAGDIPDHDLLCAGFPCQAFSVAGKRRGLDDTRGTLFFEIARIAAEKRPRYLLLENVKGLLSHDSGKTFSTILGVLADLGYELSGRYLIASTLEFPKTESECSLSDILEEEVDEKYFLSEQKTKVLLNTLQEAE